MRLNNFDTLAPLYDRLARFVYGKSIVEAQKYFLPNIPAGAKVLILGGGTGWLLAEIVKIKTDSEVWYIETSKKMIQLTREKVTDDSLIHFIHGSENDIPSFVKFDVVITNFYLDLFPTEKLNTVIGKIVAALRPGALWIATDFINTKKWWQVAILKSMYLFFKLTCSIEATHLPDWQLALQQNTIEKKEIKHFFHGFMAGVLYQKTGHFDNLGREYFEIGTQVSYIGTQQNHST